MKEYKLKPGNYKAINAVIIHHEMSEDDKD